MPIKIVDSLMYLGATLDKEVRHASELARRLGQARQSFACLAQIWSHAGLSTARMVLIYNACIVSKLLYGLQTMWLNKAEVKRLDAFHYRCLRKCLGIPHSYVSHITNDYVLQQAGGVPLSKRVLAQQLNMYARYARMSSSSIMRQSVFETDSIEPRAWSGSKRKGRPRSSWVKNVHALAMMIADNSKQRLQQLLADTPQAHKEWRACVHRALLVST